MVRGVAEETQTPIDLAGCLALAVIATAAGGRVKVCVRGHWREPVNIYTAVALDPGNRKSAVFDLMVRPLLDAEKALIELSGPVRAEAETLARLAKAAAEKAAQKAGAAEPGCSPSRRSPRPDWGRTEASLRSSNGRPSGTGPWHGSRACNPLPRGSVRF
ncbi:DUF3987 domain-containing protein [Streptomyces sp. NBC_01445]|uniref:DUF3987 domain-containing protein n=1 Tax=Streptomyces sp. NBC_01445 TaxID=2903869 RepID=UPI003FA39FF8